MAGNKVYYGVVLKLFKSTLIKQVSYETSIEYTRSTLKPKELHKYALDVLCKYLMSGQGKFLFLDHLETNVPEEERSFFF